MQLSAVACPALQYFSTFSHKRLELKKKLPNTKCVFWFSPQLLSETFLILRRTEREMIENVYLSSCKVAFILVRFQWNLKFLYRFSKNNQISNLGNVSSPLCIPFRIFKYRFSWKSVHFEPSCSMGTDRRTNRPDVARSHFLQFCERA